MLILKKSLNVKSKAHLFGNFFACSEKAGSLSDMKLYEWSACTPVFDYY